MIGKLALEAGVLPGVLNIVTGKGSVVGDALVAHPGVDKVTFTGSPSVGRGILQGAASNFKRVTLELGGKSANVIFADANLDAATRAAASGIFFNAGQVCSAGSRVLVQRAVYDDVVEMLAQRAKSIKLGDPVAARDQHGPADFVETDEDGARLRRYRQGRGCVARDGRTAHRRARLFRRADSVRERRARNAHLAGGNLRPGGKRDPFDDEADALRIANGTAYSLAAGVWSADIGRVHRMAAELKAGTVWVNTYGYTDVRLPWGGSGDSGFGREHGDVGHRKLHRAEGGVDEPERINIWQRASWFETRGGAALLTMRVRDLILRRRIFNRFSIRPILQAGRNPACSSAARPASDASKSRKACTAARCLRAFTSAKS